MSQEADMEIQGKIFAPLDLQILTYACSAGSVIVTKGKALCQVTELSIEDWRV